MKIRHLIPFVIGAFTLTSCSFLDFFRGNNNQQQQTTKATITISETAITLNAGESTTLTASVELKDSSLSDTVYWKAEKGTTGILTVVRKTGKVTVKSSAQAGQSEKVIAYLKDDESVTASCKVTVNSINPTAITLDYTSLEIGAGRSRQLSVSYTPTNANANKDVTWTTSNSSVATVANGKVTIKSNATAGQTATITAKLTNLPSVTATCNVTVSASTADYYTILLYMCGANLESDYANVTDTDNDDIDDWYGWGLATMDILEILDVAGKPDDINIVIETGGANEWTNNTYGHYSNGYSISSSKLQRHHVNSNKKIELDQTLDTYTSMGSFSTLQSFIEYGLIEYPAERTALILWNHGGGLSGVCFDEKKSNDSLTASEVATAVSGALSNCGMSGQKLEWIGYDACLMAVQDIAEINSQYFNYMVASQETESGYGWAYDKWVDDLYAYKPTTTILTAICDEFIAENGGSSSSNDQTLAYYDLSKMAAYKTAWEDMAAHITINSSNKNSFNNLIKSCRYYAGEDYTYYGLFDAKDFLNKLKTTTSFNGKPDNSYIDAVLSAFTQLVPHSESGGGAGNSNGLCLFWRCSNSYYYGTMPYSASETHFTNWRALCGQVNGNE